MLYRVPLIELLFEPLKQVMILSMLLVAQGIAYSDLRLTSSCARTSSRYR